MRRRWPGRGIGVAGMVAWSMAAATMSAGGQQLPTAWEPPDSASAPLAGARVPQGGAPLAAGAGEGAGALDRLLRVNAAAESEIGVGGRAAQQLLTAGLLFDAPSGGPRALVELRAIHGWGSTDPFPSHQGLSAIAAPSEAGLGEVWLELSASRISVRAGRMYTSDFAATGTAAEFLNPSFGLSPALSTMPTYPAARPAVTTTSRLRENGPELALGLAGQGGLLVLAQVGRRPATGGWGWSAGTIAPAERSVLPAPRTAVYLTLERPPEGRSPGLFALAARGPGPCGATATHVSAGVVADPRLPLGGRALGLGISAFGDGGDGRPEAVVEGYIRFRPAAWLYVQPDLQALLPLARGVDGSVRALSLGGLLRVGIAN